ncbi:TIGR00725 family protein [Marinobacterium lutimaris]|uniref:TIGR00725 family protein n=1 Tax=Marinobacterium lutimaris TaxID=568106 RepID=A0A1H6DLM3_9GAMM|nr:TIGR00725 family protein [Marinobacterium lutimaris]SEG86084.1 hypothetical protein SAMN05444390_107106 [Marinobacterium lutimaris]
MNSLFSIEPASRLLLRNGRPTLIRVIDPSSDLVSRLTECNTDEALLALLAKERAGLQIPAVGVIGPKQATAEQLELARQLGQQFAELGLDVICGGRNGVMEAVCRGVYERGGRSIGLLPGDDWLEANAYVTLPVVTNMGPTRNSLIAQTAFALVAVGGSHGTLTEMAYGLHYDKPVFALHDAPFVDGVQYLDAIEPVLSGVIDTLISR